MNSRWLSDWLVAQGYDDIASRFLARWSGGPLDPHEEEALLKIAEAVEGVYQQMNDMELVMARVRAWRILFSRRW